MDPERFFAVGPGWGVLIADLGMAPANVLRRAGLPGDLFSRGRVALPPKEFFALAKAIEDEVGEPNLPLLIAQAISVEAFDPAIFAAICSRDLNQAAVRIAQYKQLIGPMRLLVTQTARETILECQWPLGLQPPALLVLAELAFWVALARLATRVEIQPVRVVAPNPPEDVDAYRAYLGIAVQEGPRACIVFAAVDATRPFLTANEPMWEFLETGLQGRLAEMNEAATTSDRVRGALLELPPAGQGFIQDVSKALGISKRTLQRRLKNERSSFRVLLNETRRDLALHYLRNSHMHVGEISFLLGFQDANSFSRAFHDWTGTQPPGRFAWPSMGSKGCTKGIPVR